MSIMKSLFTAATGLGAQSDALGVVGHNIANVNTLGYKESRARFDELVANAVGMRRVAGQGSRLAGIDAVFTQGALLSTGVPTDLAIQGPGFFVLDGTYGGVTGSFYTRVGQFHVDAEGKLASPDGLFVRGYMADSTGAVSNTLGDVQLPTTVPPAATQNAQVSASLDAQDSVPANPWDPTDGSTYNFRTSMTVYDSLGAAHQVTMDFRKASSTTWEWHATVDGGELTGGTPGVLTEQASGTLGFTTDGALDSETTTSSSFDFRDATQGQVINFDFGDSITTDGGTGLAGSTAFAGVDAGQDESSINALHQDGYASGAIAGFSVQQDGLVQAAFTNGQTRTVAQLALANFRGEDGLVGAGGSLYVQSTQSGEPLIGAAGTGGRGAINAGALESSNVDLSREFVNLIAYQRGFQANARTVTTADEMMNELVNLKR
jgi:flagellar hook protein FlgE